MLDVNFIFKLNLVYLHTFSFYFFLNTARWKFQRNLDSLFDDVAPNKEKYAHWAVRKIRKKSMTSEMSIYVGKNHLEKQKYAYSSNLFVPIPIIWWLHNQDVCLGLEVVYV